ncbi:terminase family protein [Blastomonas sp. AAP53]|uniref:DNA-packaging protein n=1 Tax=Blastomonas sp. AAP53 TaxID=1248760 RepID=UPI001EE645BA|nr:terminase family protein [Blastomonas sp. AAP53]
MRRYIDGLSDGAARELVHHWRFWARPEQMAPPGDWRIWLIMAGRGFGKTRAGAEWVRCIGESMPDARIALVAANMAEARSVMVEGPSGLLAIAPDAMRPVWEPSLRRLRWPGGAQATLFSAAEPESLRGPEHSHAWCDEIAKWDNASGRAMAAWDNLQLGLRVGALPQVTATTTPRAVPLVRHLLADDGIVISRGSSHANRANLPPAFLAAVERHYGGTALGRQELDGDLLDDIEGALWSRSLIEACRVRWSAEGFVRVVIGVDPPAGSQGDACGIIVCALQADGRAAVLADCSVERASPEGWARAVSAASDAWGADRIIAEANQGGEMVGAVLRASNIALPVRLVHASRGKAVRAEPIAALYEAGRVIHCGTFARLEDEMCGLMAGGDYQGPGRSPDRADALVWALTELMLGRRGTPRIRSLED